eukprot:TRINITY_DN9900_c0_g1_i1.p1 TRINITY_DN9900_c0_g1~~TRINITY_DN9900_c0_g1_i1.p1  ORF type:complete len:527 (+),score=100.29 TRINITY_DN9900_c0_g1_i1:80-1660(+)
MGTQPDAAMGTQPDAAEEGATKVRNANAAREGRRSVIDTPWMREQKQYIRDHELHRLLGNIMDELLNLEKKPVEPLSFLAERMLRELLQRLQDQSRRDRLAASKLDLRRLRGLHRTLGTLVDSLPDPGSGDDTSPPRQERGPSAEQPAAEPAAPAPAPAAAVPATEAQPLQPHPPAAAAAVGTPQPRSAPEDRVSPPPPEAQPASRVGSAPLSPPAPVAGGPGGGAPAAPSPAAAEAPPERGAVSPPPNQPEPEGQAAPADAAVQPAPGDPTLDEAAREVTGVTKVISEASVQQITCEWEEFRTQDGRKFWQHRSSKEKTWEKPAEVAELERQITKDDWTEVRHRGTDGQPVVWYYNARTGGKQWHRPSIMDAAAAAPAVADDREDEHDDHAEIVGNWKVFITGDQRTFYVHRTTGEKQWGRPQDIADPDLAGSHWIEYQVNGQSYYQHAKTNEKTWDRHKVLAHIDQERRREQEQREKKGKTDPSSRKDLGNDWVEYQTTDGRPFYQNRVTKEKTWRRPGAIGDH